MLRCGTPSLVFVLGLVLRCFALGRCSQGLGYPANHQHTVRDGSYFALG